MLAQVWRGRLGGLRLVMLLAVLTLVSIGLASIHATGDENAFNKQLLWTGVGMAVFVLVNLAHYRWFGRISYVLFGVVLLLLVLVLAGKYLHWNWLVSPRRGSYRWLALVPGQDLLSLQPSEMAKIAYMLALAWYLRHRQNYRTLAGLLGPFALTLLPMALILDQPDLGTVLLFLPVLFSLLFVAGARIRHLLAILGIGLLLSPAFFFLMKPYQRTRVAVLLNQGTDDPYWLRGDGYQLHQSKICIGSGGWTGQGWGQGTFVKYDFLPEKHNDFIFSLIAHQWGFVGCLGLLGIYVLIIMGGIEIAAHQTEPFGRLLAVGISTLLAAQMFINVGMTMGLMPITGITLPFVSYGGSSLVVNFLALGLLVNVARHRHHQVGPESFEFREWQ